MKKCPKYFIDLDSKGYPMSYFTITDTNTGVSATDFWKGGSMSVYLGIVPCFSLWLVPPTVHIHLWQINCPLILPANSECPVLSHWCKFHSLKVCTFLVDSLFCRCEGLGFSDERSKPDSYLRLSEKDSTVQVLKVAASIYPVYIHRPYYLLSIYNQQNLPILFPGGLALIRVYLSRHIRVQEGIYRVEGWWPCCWNSSTESSMVNVGHKQAMCHWVEAPGWDMFM